MFEEFLFGSLRSDLPDSSFHFDFFPSSPSWPSSVPFLFFSLPNAPSVTTGFCVLGRICSVFLHSRLCCPSFSLPRCFPLPLFSLRTPRPQRNARSTEASGGSAAIECALKPGEYQSEGKREAPVPGRKIAKRRQRRCNLLETAMLRKETPTSRKHSGLPNLLKSQRSAQR